MAFSSSNFGQPHRGQIAVAGGVFAAIVLLLSSTGGAVASPLPGPVSPATALTGPVALASPAVTGSGSSNASFQIMFVATNGAEVESLLTNLHPYIKRGDSFDILAGGKGSSDPSLQSVDKWAAELHAKYPWAKIYVHVDGITNYRAVAKEVGSVITGVTYDYEPHYEPEFSYKFSTTVSNFKTVAAIAQEYGVQSVGYPTGIPLLKAYLTKYAWNYATLGGIVDRLTIQTQLFCKKSPTDYGRAVGVVLDQYSTKGLSGSAVFQITIGNRSSSLPHGVTASVAESCADELSDLGVHSLYLWWVEGSLSNVVKFLQKVAPANADPAASSASTELQPAGHQDLVDRNPAQNDLALPSTLLREPQSLVQPNGGAVRREDA